MELLHFVPADDVAREQNPTAMLTVMLRRGESSSDAIERAASCGWRPLKELPKKVRRMYRALVNERAASAAKEIARQKAVRR